MFFAQERFACMSWKGKTKQSSNQNADPVSDESQTLGNNFACGYYLRSWFKKEALGNNFASS